VDKLKTAIFFRVTSVLSASSVVILKSSTEHTKFTELEFYCGISIAAITVNQDSKEMLPLEQLKPSYIKNLRTLAQNGAIFHLSLIDTALGLFHLCLNGTKREQLDPSVSCSVLSVNSVVLPLKT